MSPTWQGIWERLANPVEQSPTPGWPGQAVQVIAGTGGNQTRLQFQRTLRLPLPFRWPSRSASVQVVQRTAAAAASQGSPLKGLVVKGQDRTCCAPARGFPTRDSRRLAQRVQDTTHRGATARVLSCYGPARAEMNRARMVHKPAAPAPCTQSSSETASCPRMTCSGRAARILLLILQ